MSASDDSPELPLEVRTFIGAHIDSVERLQVLLLLHQRPRAWTPLEVADERRSSEVSANLHLKALAAAGLLVVDADRYRIVADPALARLLDRVAQVFRERHVSVITFIYANPEREAGVKQPADPLLAFVDAFRIKGEKKDG